MDATLYFCVGFLCGTVAFLLMLWAVVVWAKRRDKQRPPTWYDATLRDLTKKYGMDFGEAADQQEQFDLATGERFTAE